MKMISHHQLHKYQLPRWAWAALDPAAARAVRHVYKMRLDYLASVFHDLGFSRWRVGNLYKNLPLLIQLGTCHVSCRIQIQASSTHENTTRLALQEMTGQPNAPHLQVVVLPGLGSMPWD